MAGKDAVRVRAWRLGTLGVLICLLVLCAGAPTASAAPSAVIGLSDQRPDNLTDYLFRSLDLRVARVAVPWDVALTDATQLDIWLTAARSSGLTPMVAFSRKDGVPCPSEACQPPSLERFTAAFEAFRDRYPTIRTFTIWNEANHTSQPTAAHPERVADFYDAAVERCEGCRIVAADVLDDGSMESWTRRFRARTTKEPRLWGLHNYGDLTRGETLRARLFLDLVPGEVWLTEVNAIVRLDGIFPYEESRGPRGIRLLRFLTDEFSQRLTRVYLYHWREDPLVQWDSALTRGDGTPRPSLEALASWLDLPAEPRRLIAAAAALAPNAAKQAVEARVRERRAKDDADYPARVNRSRTSFGAKDLRTRLRCPKPRGTRCRGFLALQPRRPAKPFRTLATTHFDLRPGASRLIKLVLPRAWRGRQQCSTRRRLLVSVTDADRVPVSEAIFAVPAIRRERCARKR